MYVLDTGFGLTNTLILFLTHNGAHSSFQLTMVEVPMKETYCFEIVSVQIIHEQ